MTVKKIASLFLALLLLSGLALADSVVGENGDSWVRSGPGRGYEKLAVQGDLVYGIQVFTRDEAYLRAIGQIRQGFHIIAE